ncbi:MAG TPA: hypothetical protein VF136_03870 [Methylomirabilota bacterium]
MRTRDDVPTSATSQPMLKPLRSRRAVLAGALAAVGATAARAVALPGRVLGAGNDGQNITVAGFFPDARGQTTLANSANNERVLWVASNADLGNGHGVAVTGFSANSVGVEGWSNSGQGVYGHSQTVGVLGQGNNVGVAGSSTSGHGISGTSQTGYGVRGFSHEIGVFGESSSYVGVKGKANDVSAVAVYGESTDGGAVLGYTVTGTAVTALSTSGTAIVASAPAAVAVASSGRLQFGKVSGVASIPAGSKSVTVTPGVNVTSGSFVLLTPKANIGSRALWFTTSASADTFTIRLSSPRSKNTKVAWLLLG